MTRSLLLLVAPLLMLPKTSVAQSQAPAAATPAAAVPPTAPVVRVGEAERDQARQLYDEAIQYGKKGEYRKARASLSAAWSLIKTWEIAVNLGSAEMRLGRYRDAAEHLAWGIRDGSKKEGQNYAPLVKAKSLLAEAATHVGQVKLVADEPGASILVDEEVVGKSPLSDPIFLDPGEHVITALPGNPELVSLKLEVRVQPGDALERYLRFTPAPPKIAEASDPPLTPASSGHGFFQAKTMVPITLGGLTAISGGIALAFTIKASAANSAATDWALRTGGNCDLPSPECAGLADARERRNDANRIANVAWVGAGTLGIATLITAVFWPKSSSTSTARAGIRILPRTGDDMRGVLVTGVFE
jgi:tetratricopeptide (TPR) repeat protein